MMNNKLFKLSLIFLLSFPLTSIAQISDNPPAGAPPSDAQLANAKAGYYELMVQRLAHDLGAAQKALAEKDKDWGEYSKSLWQVNQGDKEKK